jgi:hypothetical protein
MGTVLVHNISYHKTAAVRYTLDDWNTTNDVLARHEKSLTALPEHFLLASLPLINPNRSCSLRNGRVASDVFFWQGFDATSTENWDDIFWNDRSDRVAAIFSFWILTLSLIS